MHSKRERLYAIHDFLQLLPPHDSRYDTYRVQIIAQLPEFKNVYELTGIDPAHLESILLHLKNQFKSERSASRYLDSLEDWVSIANQWVGKTSQSEQRSAVTLFDSKSEILPATHTVLVPVVESRGHHASGRLRNLAVKTIGQTPASRHELTQVFSVLAGSSQQGSSSIIEDAVKHLLNELKLINKKHWQVTASFEHNDAWHSGNSADLAMGGLFFCALLEAMELKEQFRLNPAIAITGELSKTGEVKEVAAESIQQKVEAAFYSWTQVLVVPQSQLGVVYKHYEKLKEKYPNRELLIIGVQHVRDLFYDRRLTLHTKKGLIKHVSQRIWKRKFSAISVVGYLILASIIGALVIGPVDRNPTHYEFIEDAILLKNEIGREVTKIPVDPYNIENATKDLPSQAHTIIQLEDIDGDGQNEILLGLQSDKSAMIGTFTVLESNGTDTLWNRQLEFDVPYVKHPYAYHTNFRPINFQVLDIEKDGDFEILVNAVQYNFFKGMIIVYDAKTGIIEKQLNFTGGQNILISHDFDEDGFLDLLSCGLYKGWDKSGCFVIDYRDINGFLPLHERYMDAEKEIAPIKLAFQVPFTIVGKVERRESERIAPYVLILRERMQPERKEFGIDVGETIYPNDYQKTRLHLLINFDSKFNVLSIGSDDAYDRRAIELFEDRKTPFIADAQYLHSFRDSLLWWNGTDWIQQPTLNPAYLESVGDDSTYYKEWYFRED